MTAEQLPSQHQPKPPPPESLGLAGTALWLDMSGTYTLEPGEQALLLAACEIADHLAAMEASIQEDGAMDAFGRPHPAVVEHRLLAAQLGKAIAQLTPPAEKGEKPPRNYGYWSGRRLNPA